MALRSCRSARWALRHPDFRRVAWIVGQGVRLVSITQEMGEDPTDGPSYSLLKS